MLYSVEVKIITVFKIVEKCRYYGYYGYYGYLEDQRSLGSTRRILENGKLRFQGWLQTIKFKAFSKKSRLFPDF